MVLLTSVDFTLLHVLSRHSIRAYYFWQSRSLEVFLAWLLLRPMLSRILLHTFEVICPSTKIVHIVTLLEELSGLLSHLQHPVWRVA